MSAAVPSRKRTGWSYADSELSYGPPEFAEKERLVADALQRIQCGSVLDVGCHTGHFSLLAARHGARVVAIDRDPDAVGALWRTTTQNNLDILPLVIDIARPPGACGWANQEVPSFLDRARGGFDCILMLALIHHLLVAERIPLERIFELVAELTTRWAIVEYVDPMDLQFQRLARGRDALHSNLTTDSFETAIQDRFRIAAAHDITPTRRIYVLDKEVT